MIKSWNELRQVDVKPYCEKRDGYYYLNWARCIQLLHEHGAESVYFLPIQNPTTGGSLFESETIFKDKNGGTNRCYETRIEVHIDDKTYIMHAPVLNGTNAVKDNSMTQLRVWSSMCRSFVKCVAINTGLGFNLWLKEEERTLERPLYDENAKATLADIKVIKKMCDDLHINLKGWVAREGKTIETLTAEDVGKIMIALTKAKEERGL